MLTLVANSELAVCSRVPETGRPTSMAVLAPFTAVSMMVGDGDADLPPVSMLGHAQLRPGNAIAGAGQLPMCPLLGRARRQAGIPGQEDSDSAPVQQCHRQRGLRVFEVVALRVSTGSGGAGRRGVGGSGPAWPGSRGCRAVRSGGCAGSLPGRPQALHVQARPAPEQPGIRQHACSESGIACGPICSWSISVAD